MSVAPRLAVLVLRPLAVGGCREAGVPAGDAAMGPVGDLLAKEFTEHQGRLLESLKRAMERGWKAVEIALSGSAWLTAAIESTDAAVVSALRPFVDFAEPRAANQETIRQLALVELKDARKKGAFQLKPAEAPIEGLARGTAMYARFSDPAILAKADRAAIGQIAEDLKKSGFENLATFLTGDAASPLLLHASRFFLERSLREGPGLAFAEFDPLPADDAKAFTALNAALNTHARRIEELLGNAAPAAPEARIGSLDLKTEQGRFTGELAEIYQEATELLRKFDLGHARLRSGDALSARTEREQQMVRRTVDKFHALDEAQRQQMPALTNAIGQLEVAIGAFPAAVADFQAAAQILSDPAARGEAFSNAFRAALEQPDYTTALKMFLETVKTDGKRFATFPVGKYLPARVIGSGGFGVAFLCKHKYLNANVVVKSLSTDHLERDMDDVFSEAQALAAINHPAIIKVQDCGYVDPARKQRPFLVMDHFDGVTLEDYVKKNGPIGAEDFMALAEPVVAGLQAAHAKGILHRDIKPANLLVKRFTDGHGRNRWDVKLIDFGLALKHAPKVGSSHASKVGANAGTTEYASPEQLGKLEGVVVGPPSDIYGFAKTACYAMFQTTAPLLKHWKSIPQPLAELLERCLNESPNDRPKDFAIVNRCFARLGGPATESAITSAAIPTVHVAEPSESAPPPVVDDEPMYEEPRRGGGKGVLIVLMLLGTFGLLCCGGGGFGIYLGYDYLFGTDTPSTEVAGNNPGATDWNPPNNNAGRPGGNGGGNIPPVRPPDFDPFKKKMTTVTLTVNNVPNPFVADFVTTRIRNESETRDAFRAKATLRSQPKHVGDTVKVDIEAEEGKMTEFLRNLELGAAESQGNDQYAISLIAPAAPTRKPAERPEGSPLSDLELRNIIATLSKDRFPGNECRQLALAKPTPQYRNAIRALLQKHAKDTTEAVEALGVWGTAEDAEFIISLAEEGRYRHSEHIPKALGSLRAPAGIGFLARKLGEFVIGEHAYSALRGFGPIIEKDVIAALSNRERDARTRACSLLRDFGSKAAIPALKTAVQDRDDQVQKAAMEAWRTIAFHPSEPVSADPATPVAAKPKAPKPLDDAKLVVLDESASAYLPNPVTTPDGKGFFLLTPDEVRKYDWEGAVIATSKTPAMTMLTAGSGGVLVANAFDAKLLDAGDLGAKQKGSLNEPRWISMAGDANVAVVRGEGANRIIMLVDVAAFVPRGLYSDVRIPGAAGRNVTVLPTTAGKANPVLTPDGKFVFTRGNGRLYRWSVNDYKLGQPPVESPVIAGNDNGQIIVSPDGKYVAWLHPDANIPLDGLITKPQAGTATYIFDVNDIKRPTATVFHGFKPISLAFDSKGGVFTACQPGPSMLIARYERITANVDLNPVKTYDVSEPAGTAKVRHLIASSDGEKLIVLSNRLLRIDLPK